MALRVSTAVLFLSYLIVGSHGVDYLMAFPRDKILRLTARTDESGVDVTIRFPGNGTTMNISASEDVFSDEKVFGIPAAWMTDEGVEDKAVVVNVPGDRPATIYGFQQVHVKFTPLPTSNLGTYHTVHGCSRLPSPGEVILVIATLNTTKIDISLALNGKTLLYDGNAFITGDRLTLQLAQYQTVTLKCNCSFTQTVVKSSHPVAIFMWSKNFIQILPLKLAGNEFIIDSVYKDYPFDILGISTLQEAQLRMNNGTEVNLPAGYNRVVYSNDKILFFNTTGPCIVTTCSSYDLIPSNVLPTSLYSAKCYLPSCWANYGGHDIRIMTDELSEVQVSNAHHVNWTTIPGTSYKAGMVRGPDSSTVVVSNSTFNVMFTCPYPTPFFTNCGYSVSDAYPTNTDILLFEEEEKSEDVFERYLFYLNVYLFAFPQTRDPAILASTWTSAGSLEVQFQSGYKVNLTVEPLQSRSILLPTLILSDGISNGSFLARVSEQASIYGDYKKYTRSDFAPLPIKALGKEYTIVVCEAHGKSFVTIATHFYPANVSIHFSIENKHGFVTFQNVQYRSGDILVQILGKFQTLTFSSNLILTGTVIRSNQTIAVFKESPSFFQLLPNELANNEFIISKLDFDQSPVAGNELIVTSLYNHTTIKYGQVEYEVKQKGTFKSHFSLFEFLHIKSNKPVLIHTCSFKAYQDVVLPTTMFPSECVLPICLPLYKPQDVIILTYNQTEVDVSDAYVEWSDIEGSDYKRGKARVESDRPVHVSSSSKFNVLSACPMTPFFTYCGFNVSVTDYPPDSNDDLKQTDQHIPSLIGDLDNAYIIAFPALDGTDCQPAVEVYTGSSAGVIHVNTSRAVSASLRVSHNSYGNITRPEWWSKQGIDSGALILRKLVGSQINIYAGCHRYSYENSFEREAKKSFAPIPLSALGKSYTLVVCGRDQRSFSVASFSNYNIVSISFVFENFNGSIQFHNRTYKTGDVLVQHLQQFQTLTFSSDLDITGTKITGLEAVAVFYHSSNMLQLLPDQLAGSEYIISKITDVNTHYDRYNILITSEYVNTDVAFADETYHVRRKGTIHREYLLHEHIHFETSKPVLVHTCTFKTLLDVIPPVTILPSQCILPICLPYEKNERIIILSNATIDVDLTYGTFSWKNIYKSIFKVGFADVKSPVPMSVKSEKRFYVLSACPSSVCATTCGYNISKTEITDKLHDPLDESNLESKYVSGLNITYLLAFPSKGGEGNSQPLVEMYNFDTDEGETPLCIQPNMDFDIVTHNSYYRISNADWWSRQGVENKSIIITKMSDQEVNIYAGFNSYSRNGGFQRSTNRLTPLIPINALGREYTVIVCEFVTQHPMAMAIATHFYTADVTITFVFADEEGSVTFDNKTYRHGDKLEYRLQEYQTLTIIVAHDITGTKVNSTETIAVFLQTPNFVQLFPDKLADQEFVMTKFNYIDTDSSFIFITSIYDNTDVLLRKNTNHVQTRGTIRLDFLPKETPHFRTTKPVLVHTCSYIYYLHVVPPTSMFKSKCTLPLCVQREDIIILSYNTTLVNVSGAEVQWTDIKDSEYKVGRTSGKYVQPVRVDSASTFNVLSACPLSPFFTYCGFNISMSHFPVFVNESLAENEIIVDGNSVWDKKSETVVIAITVTLLVLMLVLMVTLPYCLWKRRAVFIMKLVYRFQAYEDHDDREYDAFISYRSTEEDESFVVHTLFPKLEKELNFTVCVHFRDFMPGETIANNIIEAIEKSRRTILVMTPAYIRSEFCRFEYQRAQHEMLKQKQRIIPIILKDITDARPYMDDTLRTILNSITYLEWPSDGDEKKLKHFWGKLVLAMPKVLRNKQNVNNISHDNVRQNGEVMHIDSTEISTVGEDITRTNNMADVDATYF